MAYKVNPDVCINCGACESACPVGAISEQDGKRHIDDTKCVECGACAGTCPVSAIAL
ncbi:MAG: 4Fe-4S binding protein [Elusimicrobia bacterium]|nr:4Fe-4S binding protein [Elusimicrobiota bacterium]MDD7501591.1 4Fe-4S binding protein [Elusimicrobiota bacterium]MDY5728679.1 4Fe-4S binding protein [Elusimicrobiaceae bacterium]